jgi:hypothetical protein
MESKRFEIYLQGYHQQVDVCVKPTDSEDVSLKSLGEGYHIDIEAVDGLYEFLGELPHDFIREFVEDERFEGLKDLSRIVKKDK